MNAKTILLLYALPAVVVFVHILFDIRWLVRHGEMLHPHVWRWFLQVALPALNLWLAACCLLLDLCKLADWLERRMPYY